MSIFEIVSNVRFVFFFGVSLFFRPSLILNFAKLSSVKFSASQVELRLALLSLNSPPHPPGQVYLSHF